MIGDNALYSQEHYPFIKLGQYMAGLTTQQDVWGEVGRALVSFFGVDVVAFGERRGDGEIMAHHWTFSDQALGETVLSAVQHGGRVSVPADVEEAIIGTLESGFLTSRVMSRPEPLSLAFMPIVQENQTTAVMVVGHRSTEPLPKELLDLYLAVARLVGTTAARLASERELRRHRHELTALVEERTDELTESNERLQREIEQRRRAEEKTEHLNRVLRAINNVNQLIVREKRRDRLLQAVCDLLIETWGYHNAWIALFDEAGRSFSSEGGGASVEPGEGPLTVAEAGLGEAFSLMVRRLERGALPDCARRALMQAEVVVTEDPPRTCTDCPLAASYAGRGGMAIRLAHRKRIYGLLVVSVPAYLAGEEKEQALLRELGGDIGFALHDIALEEARRRTAQALRESRQRLATLMSNLPGMAYRCANKPGWPMDFVSEGGLALTGYAPAELTSAESPLYGDLIHPEDREMVWNAVQEAVRAGEPFVIEYRLRDKEGRERWVWEQGCAVDGGSASTAVLEGFILDITERKRADQALQQAYEENVRRQAAVLSLAEDLRHEVEQREQAEEALRAYSERLEERVEARTRELRQAQEKLLRREKLAMLGQLAGSINHELRGPLGNIKSGAYFLNMAIEEPEEDVRETLELLEQEVDRAETIIRSLLSFVRTGEPRREAVDVNALLGETLAGVEIPEAVTMVREMDEDLPTVWADPEQLRQVFRNLISNAVEAMPEGGRLTVETFKTSGVSGKPPRSAAVVISVADTGEGIPAERRERLFEPLFSTKAEGVGLGLALARMLVEAHGGVIEVESEVGRGSTFTVRLPGGGRGDE